MTVPLFFLPSSSASDSPTTILLIAKHSIDIPRPFVDILVTSIDFPSR